MPEFSSIVETLRSLGYTPECGWPSCDNDGCYRDSMGYDGEGYDRNGFNRAGYNRDGINEDGYDRYGGYHGDDDFWGPTTSSSSGAELHNYSYTPMLKFNGEKPPWYGLELEVTTDQIGNLLDTVEEYAPSLIYCKEDGSVDGAELVTHPMSYDWAMAKFPWEMLPAIRSNADATVIPSDNGIHVHVSRDGFSDPAHMFRWFKVWYRNPNDIQRIARRHSASWASFRANHRSSQFEHVKRNKPGYGRGYYQYERDETLSRYSAINTTNDATLEVRVFASTLRPQRAKAALQLVAGSVEYARQLTTEDITHRHGWDWQAFMAWARKDERYPDLVSENRIRR